MAFFCYNCDTRFCGCFFFLFDSGFGAIPGISGVSGVKLQEISGIFSEYLLLNILVTMQTMMKLSIQHLVTQHLQHHQNQLKITIILSQIGDIVSHLQTAVSDQKFRFEADRLVINNIYKSCQTSNMIDESQSGNIFYYNDKSHIYSLEVLSLKNLICNMFEFLDLRECIAKAKQQDWNHLFGMENNVKETVEYVDAVNSFERFKNIKGIDMKNYHSLKYSRFDDLFSKQVKLFDKIQTITLRLDFITYDEQGIPINVDKARANAREQLQDKSVVLFLVNAGGKSTFTTNPFDAALNSGNNNNNNNNNSHTSLNNFESESDTSSKQEAFLNNNNRQRPSINTASKTYDIAKELENEIEQKLRKKTSFKHARNRSTQIAKQVSGDSDTYVKKVH